MADKRTTLQGLIDQASEHPAALARLAHALAAHGDEERARELCDHALALAPDDGEVRVLTSEVFARHVPEWYFPMVLDKARNRLYDEVIRRTVRPGDLVLEIGTGTGLMAMMAARAGAKVVTCERLPALAAAVSQVVARNGFANRIEVLPKLSMELEIGKELKRPADIVVWDNLANNLIGAGALPAVEHAARHLARPGARFIPGRGTIRVALADDLEPERVRMGMVEGFDMSAFNRVSPARYEITDSKVRFPMRSEAARLFDFDFASGGPFPEARTEILLGTHGGRISGVMQWFRLDLDEDAFFERPPPGDRNAAACPMFHPFHRPVDLKPGEILKLHASHDRQSVRIWAELPK